MLRMPPPAQDSPPPRIPPASRDPLVALARAANDGDTGALRALLTSVSPLVLRIVRGLLGANHPDVDDMLQEALIGLARALPSFRSECTVAHFAARIAVRRTTDARRLSRERASRDIHAGSEDVPRDVTQPDDATRAARRRQLIRSLLDTLPEPQAEAMVFRFVLGYSLEEIATASGAPLNTVRSRLRLAREALRRTIEEDPALAELWEAAS